MYVYLQPFYTKGLIDQVSNTAVVVGDSMTIGQQVSFRAQYLVAAASGLAQSVSYFALWVLSSLSCFATVALISALDRWSDLTGGLAVASMMATVMALSSAFYLPAARILTKKIVDNVDASFTKMVDNFVTAFVTDAERQRNQRKSLAMAHEEDYDPEAYFDPVVEDMLKERRALQEECRLSYPSKISAKGSAYTEVRRRFEVMSVEQASRLHSTPYSRKEIDDYLEQEMASLAEAKVAELYRHVIQTWSTRIHEWGREFNREAFCRNCVEIFREKKVVKIVGRLLRDVKEADDKDQTFRDNKLKLVNYITDIKSRIDGMTGEGLISSRWPHLHSDEPSTLFSNV